MLVAVVIPNRGDRPQFMENCLRMMEYQTRKADFVIEVSYPAKFGNIPDISARYKKGIATAIGFSADVILLIENDDYYAPNYIETMLREWQAHGKPDLFGIGESCYYHLGLKKCFFMEHTARACAMNTLIKANAEIVYPIDSDPYFDLYLWLHIANRHLIKTTIKTPDKISLGIKHGVWLTGGEHHTTRMERYNFDDSDYKFLRSIINENDIFNFYTNVLKNE